MPLVIVAALLIFLPARAAFADGCTDLGGAVVGAECQLAAPVKKSGTFNIDQQTLRILAGGTITVPVAASGNTLTINVCAAPAACDFIMEAGAKIIGNVVGTGTATGVGATINVNATGRIELQGDGTNGALISSNQNAGSCTAGGRGGNINLVAGFDITTQAGSEILADGTPCPGGSIKLISAQGNVTTAGLISSVSTMSGTGAQQFPGGGPITIIARCKATVGGTVESKGGDSGADLIHIEAGCEVVIDGLVQSTAGGHAVPNAPANHCFGPILANPSRPDKDPNSTACIEVWSGGTLTINPTAELNADTGGGGNVGTSWIDLFARGDILIDGNAVLPFAVHANGLGGSVEFGGVVTVKSTQGSVAAHGKALQANANKNNGDHGGNVTVAALIDVAFTLNVPTLEAMGKGTTGVGGAIAARAFTGALTWLSGIGDVTPKAGTIKLEACTPNSGIPASALAGTTFNGAAPSKSQSCDPAGPTLPPYVILQDCVCLSPGPGVPCPEDPFRLVTWTVGLTVPLGVPNSPTLSQAVAAASSGHIIGMFGNTTENVSIPNKSFTITQCTVARITALDPTKPAVGISTPDTILVIGLDTAGGTIGWLLTTDGHELRGVRAKSATEAGIKIEGSGNRVSWNLLKKNGAGIVVSGSGNDLRGGTVETSTGHGVHFSATAQANLLQGANIQLNRGHGIVIEGSGNTVRDNARVDSNRKNGVLVTGSNNLIKANVMGSDKSKGNGQNGVMVTGAFNKLDSNKASANLGDGFNISGGTAANPNKLKGNQSNVGGSGQNKENQGAEYRLANTVTSLDGNKADGVSVPKAAKCPEFPKKNETKDFQTPFICE
jgi:hypothetical protein